MKAVPLRWRTMTFLEVIMLCKNSDFKPMNDIDFENFERAHPNSLIAYAYDITSREYVLILDEDNLYIMRSDNEDASDYVIYALRNNTYL